MRVVAFSCLRHSSIADRNETRQEDKSTCIVAINDASPPLCFTYSIDRRRERPTPSQFNYSFVHLMCKYLLPKHSLSNENTNMPIEHDTRTSNDRLSKIVNICLWHFHHMPVPYYTQINVSRSRPAPMRPVKKERRPRPIRNEQQAIRDPYRSQYRTCSIRERTSTLTSIREE